MNIEIIVRSFGRYFVWKFCLLFLFLVCGLFSQQEKTEKTEFLRLTDSSLQTAIYTLSNSDSTVRLKLIGVIHVGDAQYYRNILLLIKDLDFLYYEGIHPDGDNGKIAFLTSFQTEKQQKINKKGIKDISKFQNEFAKSFDLVEQSEYLKPEKNWINADVTIRQFLDILKKHQLNLEELAKNLSLDAKTSLEDDTKEMDSLSTEKDQNAFLFKYKRKMAKYLVKSAEELCFDAGMKIPREAIIIERNRVALRYLQDKLNSTVPQELGLLYGAAHMPHLIEVLQKEHNFQIHSVEWLDAWSLRSP